MAPRRWFKQYTLYTIVTVIAVLLVGNMYLVYLNSQRIEHNKNLHEEAERIKVNTMDIVRNLHLLDMALRSYALTGQYRYITVADTCILRKNVIFDHLEQALSGQSYPMENFYAMRDSVNAYYTTVDTMKSLLVAGHHMRFLEILEPDPGYRAWEVFTAFSDHVNQFEDVISRHAQEDYERALRSTYWLQVILFIIAMPTLAYTAYYTRRSLRLSDELNRSTEENFRIVSEQKDVLEEMVKERTREILEQNQKIETRNELLLQQRREIELQRNELREQNEELQNAKHIIELQNKQIKLRHDELAREVDRQTQDLKKTNFELIEYNNRLEQFAYIISHNLRAPMARLVGLAHVLDHARNAEESQRIIRLMTKSTGELEQVIKDLGVILGVEKTGSLPISEVDLQLSFNKVVEMLEPEIKETGAQLEKNFEVEKFYSLAPYIDSILYNLISNALKYRHPERPPVVRLKSRFDDDMIAIEVQDNGLGIDLEKNKENLFNLYKRFHFHVEGKGLGLYLVKTQVLALGGRIDVDSKLYEGTTFRLLFEKKNGAMNGAGLYSNN